MVLSRPGTGFPGKNPHESSKNIAVPEIAFLGLWDTVDAYGLPIDELKNAWNWFFPLSFPNRNPHPKIKCIRHALAIDDERHTFHPVLLNESKLAPEQDVKQVWFSGVHTNVGGGYPDDALAMVTLDWMMSELKQAPSAERLVFKDGEHERIKSAADVGGKLYDSRRGLAGVYRYKPRKIEALIQDPDNEVDIERAKIHETVFGRITRNADGYAPIVLPKDYEVVNGQRGVLNDPHHNPAKKSVFEHPTQAEDRANAQEKVWNRVWWRRVVYFASVGVGFWLAVFPLLYKATGTCEGAFCAFSSVVRGIGILLPGFVEPWLSAYESHPGKFLLVVALLAALLIIGGAIQDRIKGGMRAIWEPIIKNPDSKVTPRNPPQDWLYRLRTHPLYERFFHHLRTWLLPAVFALLFLILLFFGLSRALFAMMSSSGMVCTPTAAKTLTQGTLQDGQFASAAVCWATGVEVSKGKRYRITLVITDPGKWKDGNYNSGIDGLKPNEVGLLMSLRSPLRRHLSEPRFKPIARIGSRGSDEYPLNPSASSIAD